MSTPQDHLIETLDQLLTEIKKPEEPPYPKKLAPLMKFLNSPAFLTIFGGLIIAVVGWMIQGNMNRSQLIAQQSDTLYQRKLALVSEFADGIVKYMNVAEPIRHRAIWLVEYPYDPKKKQDEPVYSDNRTWTETRKYCETLSKEFWLMKQSDSLCAEVAATYDSLKVKTDCAELDIIMDEYISTPNQKRFTELGEEATKKYKDLLNDMALELKQEKEALK